jgi:ATP-dependent Lhr-like helicase
MDVDGFLDVLRGLRDGRIERRAVDAPAPSAFAAGILAAQPYAFLDDAPLEERRTQAVLARRTLDVKSADELGALDPEANRRVREEAWPAPGDAEEVHEALLWMGYLTEGEGAPWLSWLHELEAAGRVELDGGRWFAREASRDPLDVLRGRLEALGPVVSDDPLLYQLEREGTVLRGRFEGQDGWCSRRLLARIHRYTLDRLRKEIEPVTASDFLRFLASWQHVDEDRKLEGPRGVAEVLRQLAGFDVPAAAWEATVLPARIRGYRREWLDELTLSGEFAWGRVWGSAAGAARTTPLCFVRRDELLQWTALGGSPDLEALRGTARDVHRALAEKGAMFTQELARAARLLEAQLEAGLGELVSRGLATCDSYGGLRQLIAPASRRRVRVPVAGRWSLVPRDTTDAAPPVSPDFVARQLLLRTGVVFKRTTAREKQPLPWRDIVRALRTMEARGEVRGGRFVAGFDGEQYALPEAVPMLRAVRRARQAAPGLPVYCSAADPLNLRGILTPDDRVSPLSRGKVLVA